MSPEVETKHKKLTRFLCQELLYEYVSGNLDSTRKKDVDEYLPTCRDSQRELENLKKGLHYAVDVASIQVSPSLRSALEGFEPAWKRRLQNLTLWSSQRGWRMLPYGFLAGALALGLYVTKPWKPEARKEVVLAEQARSETAHAEGPLNSPQVAKATNIMAANTPAPLVQNGVMAPSTATAPAPETAAVAVNGTENGKPKTENTVVAVAETAVPSKSAQKAAEANEDDEKKENLPGSGKGYLLRGQISVKGFAAAWPAVRDKIISLGGHAAGNVELGWLRRPDESYFHFSLPESNFSELETFLKTFGPVRISKERHPRVMPEGQIRIILTIKDGAPNETEAEAP